MNPSTDKPSFLLQAQALRCERDDRLLFDGLSFALSRGEALRIEGPNGAGKTTLIRVLAGLAGLWEGQLSCNRESLLFVGHDAAIKLALTAEENLRWFAALHAVEADVAALRLALDSLGLRGYEDVPCARLSAGQRRRVALARLLLIPATLWVLDEPFTALDMPGCSLLAGLLCRHLDAGGAVVFSSHQEVEGLQVDAAVQLAGRETRYVRFAA